MRMVGLMPEMTTDTGMPAAGEPLTAEQIATLRAWVDEGAVWPETPASAAELRENLRALERGPLSPEEEVRMRALGRAVHG